MTKSEVYQAIKNEIESKLFVAQLEMDEISASLADNTKSTAGDKHETSRAMAQLEQEKLGKQLIDLQQQRNQLISIGDKPSGSTIEVGSLVETNIGWFYIGVPLGQLKLGEATVFCLSVLAPIGQILFGKSINEVVNFNGNKIEIKSIT